MSARTIYSILRSAGLTEAGVFALMGNFQSESGLEPGRVQGDFSTYRSKSKEYVAGVTSGAISRDEFAKDAKGFGLAQWTFYSRKYDLYDFWKQSGTALDDDAMQARFVLKELATGQYSSLLALLKSSNDLWTCTVKVCSLYEQPAFQNTGDRFSAAKELQAEFAETPILPSESVSNSGGDAGTVQVPSSEYWPPRTICNGMSGCDTEVLQAVLRARGYDVNFVDGAFAHTLEEEVKRFQKDYGLDVDGIVGPKTWGELLKR